MRIGGLATGMDTESIIKDMMNANRIPLDKITQKKQYLEWQLNDYRSINRDLQSTITNLNDKFLRPSTFAAKNVSISNPNAVSIKSMSATSEFSGTISVQRLATQATVHGAKIDGIDMTKTLENIPGFTGAASITINAVGKNGEMTEKSFDFDTSKDTIDSVLKKINSDSDVSAFYDTFTGQFAFTAKNSGTNNEGKTNDIVLTGELATSMGVNGVQSKNGENAEFTFNGLTTQRSSNTFQINGFEVTLKQVTGSPDVAGSAVTFSSAPDTDKIMESVVKFVDDYNKMIEELNAKISEKKYRDFQPLSAEQKKDMKEKEIELWEEKAMSGTLRSDPTISSLLTKMRSALNSNDNGGLRLSDIGITTSKDYLDNGKLIIDEDKLRKAITEDPNKVSQVFIRPSTGEDKGGVAIQLRNVMDESRKSIAQRAGSAGAGNSTFTLGRTLKGMDEQIVRFEDRMKVVENRLWKQFTAMEMAIQKANAQSAQLMNAFGGA